MTTRIQMPSSVIPSAREDSRFGKYRFPMDIGPNSIVLDFQKYSYQRTTQGVSPTARTTTSIILPLPQQIIDAYNVVVGEQRLSVGGAFVVDKFSKGGGAEERIKEFLEESFRSGQDVVNSGGASVTGAVSTAGQYAKFISRNILDSLPFEGLSLAADLVNGSAVNPHTTLNFDGVNLKQFQFNWQLAPRSERESDVLKNIIAKIKSHILPKYSTLPGLTDVGNRAADRALLRYPDLLLVRFNGLAQDHYFEFLPGMVNNFSVDYSTQGNVILEGGKPAVVNMSMTFTEAQIHTSGRYDASTDGASIAGPF